MTDNEIIKALDFCGGYNGVSFCSDCSLINEDNCTQTLSREALDLINRQKDRVQELEIELQVMRNAANGYKAEIEKLSAKISAKDNTNDYNTAQLRIAREKLKNLEQENSILSRNADTAFQDGLNEAQDLYAEQVKTEVKSKAIKEFAERLRTEYEDEKQGRYIDWLMTNIIDNLVKEMTEVENETQQP